MELERTEDIFVNLGYGSPSEYNDNYQQFKNKVVEIRAKYNKQRKRAIWWAMYGVDVVVFSVVVLLLVWGIWQFFF